MKFSFEISYDAAPDRVLAMLSDPAFREEVCRRGRAVEHHVEIDGAGTGMRVVVDQTLPADNIPSFAKKVVGERIQIKQTETWTGAEGADLEVAMPGKPAQVHGRIALSGQEGRTVQTVTGDVKVSLPLVGGKLEQLIADVLGSALRNEQRVGRAWLTEG